MRLQFRSPKAAGLLLAASALALAACDSSADAPTNVGVCWRLAVGKDGPFTFKPLSTGVRNLETCAAHLEAVSLREGKSDVTGAYQGQFIFITPDMVQSSMRLAGARYRLFDAETRAKIDRDLRWMLEDEKRPSKFAPSPQRPGPPAGDARGPSAAAGGVTHPLGGPISSPP
jgi:hypothetical protein